MARPLTKTKPDGALYVRSSGIEAEINEAVRLSSPELRARLLSTDQKDRGYLSHECLVHLVRQGRRSNDQVLMNAVLPVLLGRCEVNLRVKVPDGGMPDAAGLRQEILDELTDLFVMDGSGDGSDELDFYECKFNKAFRALRIDAVRRDVRQRRRVEVVDLSPSEATREPADYEDAFARVSDAFKVLPTQEWDAVREPLVKAIEALPPDERKAVILVHVLGYKEESEDPDEETAATRCNCTGRTIRNRLTRAAAKLSRFREDI
jgi:hypothetical protein